MNTLQILNVLQSDPFTKSVFTSVLPSDRLPGTISEKPKGFVVNVDGSDGPGTHWVATVFTWQLMELESLWILTGKDLPTTANTLKRF